MNLCGCTSIKTIGLAHLKNLIVLVIYKSGIINIDLTSLLALEIVVCAAKSTFDEMQDVKVRQGVIKRRVTQNYSSSSYYGGNSYPQYSSRDE